MKSSSEPDDRLASIRRSIQPITMLKKWVAIIQWVMCLTPLFLMLSVLLLFFYSYSDDSQFHEAGDVPGTFVLIRVARYFVFQCVAILPVWIVTGIADLLDNKNDFFRLRYIGTFLALFCFTSLVFKLVGDMYHVNIVSWCFG